MLLIAKPARSEPSFGLMSLLLGVFLCTSTLAQQSSKQPFYIGTYTGGDSQGIYLSFLDSKTAKLSEPKLVAEIENPSFLALHPTLDVLYAVSEVAESDHQITAFNIGSDFGLTELSHRSTDGGAPCFVSVTADGKSALVANYSGGSVASFPLNENGSLGEIRLIQHTGSSVHPRQKAPHGHCILPDPSDQYAAAVDLGLDQVLIYKLDENGLGAKHSVTHFKPGSGPRHIAFHPNGKHAFVIHELTCQLSTCSWNRKNGMLTESQMLSTLPGDFQKGYSTAEVLVHPSGKFVYGSNRGHHSIAGFRFKRGKLTPISHTDTGGETPRNFRIDPTGKFLLTENQSTDSIVLFEIDEKSGELSPADSRITVGSPVCVKFLNR